MALPRLFKKPKHHVPDSVSNSLEAWFESDIGQKLLAEEQRMLDQILPSLFGYHQLQAGIGILPNSLRQSTVSHKFLVSPVEGLGEDHHRRRKEAHEPVQLRGCLDQLPIQNDSVDSAVLHHSLEFEPNVNQILRETARVLMPGGSLVIVGFNPWSLWGFWRYGVFKSASGPWSSRFVSPHRLSEWLELLDFEVEGSESAYYLPPINNQKVLKWFSWLQPLFSRWFSQFGACYILVAKKRVSLVTPIRPKWRPKVRQLVPVPMPQTNRTGPQTKNPS